ncbi:putative cytochrome P450 [Streptomyces davaonensis JCM 4913]|uniref:Putative cytochrome P450 n=1 Tax=Streptomyces davaonensis (strain DSM 101723 / JCM 4913 / KCC S-0913 / 768) TaxID=1214101 RepID=K4QZ69_STRDJ|nr:cytochrome P450 [Streptomyces davaonensis]CCK25684.1 putative cytochrome P450 [Streptomyces davaonensis JCM 4913]
MTSATPAPPPFPPPGCPAHESLYGPEFAADPATVYGRLRDVGPIAPVELAPGVRASLVVGYEAALHVLRGTETFSKDARRWKDLADGTVPADSPVVPMMMYRPNALWTDGTEHRRLRGAITDSLARIDSATLRGYVEASADTLIDRIAPAGQADLLGEYAQVLPLLVFNRMFGCPADYGERLVRGMSGIFDGVDAEQANNLLATTLLDLVTLKRRQPGPDVTSWLMAHSAELTDEEMVHTLVLLMGAGTEPQQNLIANSLRLLLSDDRFAGSLSGGSLPVEEALDEVLWTDPPMANYAVHYAIHDVVYEGALLRAGQPLVVSLAAANTDPALTVDQRAGNRAHLAWSAGPHNCPAQGPARLIAAVAVEKLLDRLPDVELSVPVEDLAWRPGPFHRALAALPVTFPPTTVTPPTPGGDSPLEPVAPTPRPSAVPPVGRVRRGWGARLLAWWRGE